MEQNEYNLLLNEVRVSSYDLRLFFKEGNAEFDFPVNYCIHKHKQFMFIYSDSQESFLNYHVNEDNETLHDILINILNKKIPEFPIALKECLPF